MFMTHPVTIMWPLIHTPFDIVRFGRARLLPSLGRLAARQEPRPSHLHNCGARIIKVARQVNQHPFMILPPPKKPPQDPFDLRVLAELPLAESFYTLWGYLATDKVLKDLFDAYRGKCYQDQLTFAE